MICVHVRVHVRVRVRACLRMCVHVRACAYVCIMLLMIISCVIYNSLNASKNSPSPSFHLPCRSTLFYAYDGVLFEVMSNQHLSSVTLFYDF